MAEEFIGKEINVRMMDKQYPCYKLTALTEPKHVITKVDGIVVQYLYTCTVLQYGYPDYVPLRVYLSTYDWVNPDSKHLQYWDTAQTLPDFWLELLVEREIAQTVDDLQGAK